MWWSKVRVIERRLKGGKEYKGGEEEDRVSGEGTQDKEEEGSPKTPIAIRRRSSKYNFFPIFSNIFGPLINSL